MNDRDVINDILADDWLDIPIFLRDKVNARADRLLARAEAAEAEAVDLHRQLAEMAAAMEEIEDERLALAARVAELEAQVASHRRDYNGLYDEYHELRYRSADIRVALHAARQRVAELEAQLAAQGWRPVTAEWPPYGVQHLGRAMLNSPTLLVTRIVYEGGEVWQDDDGMLFYGGEIRYCAAIPPTSQEPTP